MKRINEPTKNPPAFPSKGVMTTEDGALNIEHQHPGMTLRDYFAGQILIGFMSRKMIARAEEIALTCYHFADAMLKERNKNE